MGEYIMKIEILGMGCAKCKKFYENAQDAARQLNITADIVKVEDMGAIVDYGIMTTPAMAIDGQVKSAGKVLTTDEIKQYLNSSRSIKEEARE
jgi:small redox-active disulfide protein 2